MLLDLNSANSCFTMTSNMLLHFCGLWASAGTGDRTITSVFNELELCQRPGDRLSMITVTTLYSILYLTLKKVIRERSGV
jgi:hypothetical protein